MDANKKWLSIPKDTRSKLLNNVFCANCLNAVSITGFIIEDHALGMVLKGKCKNCGHEVARVVETVRVKRCRNRRGVPVFFLKR